MPQLANLYDDTYLQQIQRSLAVQSGALLFPRVLREFLLCSYSCFCWAVNV